MNSQHSETQKGLKGLPVGRQRCAIRVVQNESDVILVYQPEGKLTERKLVFESAAGSWEVTRFPAEWRRLTDDELLGLRGD